MDGLSQLWVYLAGQPLLWLAVTVSAYALAQQVFLRSGQFPLLNPVLVAITLVVVLLLATGTGYDTYFEGGQYIHFLLGPATVLLAVPLHAQIDRLRRQWLPLSIALLAGSVTAIASTIALGLGLGLNRTALMSLMPKSATSPIAMGVAEKLGGEPALAAVFVIISGILGAVAGIPLLRLLGERDPAVKGFAMGVAAHGIATARAFQHSNQSGAYAGLGMGLNGVLTALLVPLFAWLFGL